MFSNKIFLPWGSPLQENRFYAANAMCLTVIRNGTVLTRIYGTANTIPQTAVVCAGVFVSTHSLPQTLGIATLTWS